MVETEKLSWVLPHELKKNQHVAQSQLSLLSKFGPTLYLCYKDNSLHGITYQHWFVTDRSWTIEFGGGEIQNASVLVHNNPKGNYMQAETFPNTNDVRNRMAKVCGATNYSLALRNCEHVARYIFCGIWACFQMTGEGDLRKIFFDYMAQNTKLINTLPKELEIEKPNPVELNTGITDFVREPIEKKALTSAEDKLFNILFLGPTGCGKSTIINQMFNLDVCKADSGINSVTKEINYVQGTYSWPFEIKINGEWKYNQVTKVNIIDTVGFCDSLLSTNQVLALVKNSVKVNLTHLDKVVICCSGRLEADHKKSIKQFMEWLKYNDNKRNFVFFYTKTDGLTEEEKQRNLLSMCEALGIDSHSSLRFKTEIEHIKSQVKLVDTVSFGPNASSADISINREKIMKTVLAPREAIFGTSRRISVSESNCTIL